MVAARAARCPVGSLFARASTEMLGGECVEATNREVELFGGLSSAQRASPEGVEHMTNE